MAGFELAGVFVRKGDATLLADIDLSIATGVCTALVGPSGAGKSTLLRLLNRFEEPSSGTIRLDGELLSDLDVLALRRRVVLVPQRPTLLTPTVAQDVRVGAPSLADDEVSALLARAGLDATFLHRESGTLSGGEAQRVCLARSLAVGPQVLLLDEPTSSLDATSVSAVEATIASIVASGLTVVIVSHDRSQARRLADTAVVLTEGRIVEVGRPAVVHYLTGEDAQ